jgi:ABC-type transport system substrate-binding protein
MGSTVSLHHQPGDRRQAEKSFFCSLLTSGQSEFDLSVPDLEKCNLSTRKRFEYNFIPQLAAEVPTVDNGGISADGLSWKIKLCSGVTWHDGALHGRGH